MNNNVSRNTNCVYGCRQSSCIIYMRNENTKMITEKFNLKFFVDNNISSYQAK